MALVLAIDISSSVDATEEALQRDGLAAALRAPQVQDAFFSGDLPVALAVYGWSGRYNQVVLLDWTLVAAPHVLRPAADRLASSTRSHDGFATEMGVALEFGSRLLARAPDCLRKTLDMAGDWRSNEDIDPTTVYAQFPFSGVTVNCLVVNAAEYEAETGLIAFYQSQVIRGPGAYVEIAQSFENYGRAMRRKLIREVSQPVIGTAPASGEDPKG